MEWFEPYQPIQPEQYGTAFNAGHRWASCLKPGDYFNGAANEAERRYKNRHEQMAFTDGACSVFYEVPKPVFIVDKPEKRVIRFERMG